MMGSFAISLIVLACVFGGALFGMFLTRLLPRDHLSPASTDLLKMGMGLIGTMAAMVLGLMLASAKSSYDTQKGELNALSAKILLLDRILAHYGPDAQEARDALRGVVAGTLDRVWPKEGPRGAGLGFSTDGSEVLDEKIQTLSPKSDEQREAKSEALSMLIDLGGARWLMVEQQSNSFSEPFIIVVVSWLTVIFISFGLVAPRNATVVVALLICALSVSTAIFLILELYSPFEGMIQISSAPLRNALVHLGQ